MGTGGADIPINLTTSTAMNSYLWFNPALPDAHLWRSMTTGNLRVSDKISTTSVTTTGSNSSLKGHVVETGDILQLFKLYFKKLPGQTLSENTFRYYNRAHPPVQQNQFYHGAYFRQIGVDEPPAFYIYPQMFTRRSPATIATETPMVHGTKVILTGLANAEHIAKQTDPLQLLDWDNIHSAGFIYSKNDVALTIDAYSKKIKVDGAEYDFPTIANGVFMLGNYSFNIITKDNTNNNTRIGMKETIKGLDADETYYAYAFMTYNFQTSHVYPALGERITFRPTVCDEQPLVFNTTDFTVCNTAVHVNLSYDNYTEAAVYKLLFDSEGVGAGFTNVSNYLSLPESNFDVSIPYGVSAGTYTATLFVRDGDCEKEYYLTIEVTTSPKIVSTSAKELSVKTGEEFYMLVETAGTAQYQWYFNGTPISGATQFFYSDVFEPLKEGFYVVRILNECGDTFVEFKVNQMLNIPDEVNLGNYKLTVYPNPSIRGTKQYLSLEVPKEETFDATAHIMDVTGKEVSKFTITHTLTELKLNVAEGTYLVKVNTKSGKELLTKIIVQ